MRRLLVLDLDETLIHTQKEIPHQFPDFIFDGFFVFFRPNYKDFLKECGKYYDIGIWTASTSSYAHPIVTELFRSLPPPVFIFSRDKCSQRIDWKNKEMFYVKRLKKVRKLGYSLTTTLVVDDRPETFQENYGNGIEIKPYYGQEEDEELYWLVQYLISLNDEPDVRLVDKSFWKRLSSAVLTARMYELEI
jgi:RNA polymerase II subunit A small phosphatase-like protein